MNIEEPQLADDGSVQLIIPFPGQPPSYDYTLRKHQHWDREGVEPEPIPPQP